MEIYSHISFSLSEATFVTTESCFLVALKKKKITTYYHLLNMWIVDVLHPWDLEGNWIFENFIPNRA